MISPLELQKLRDLPIEGVAQRLGLDVSRGRFLCPAHTDHTPSASISRKNPGHWKCWSCGAGGNAIDLTMLVLNKDFREACEWLADGSLSLSLPNREVTGCYQKPDARKFEAGRYARFFEHPYLSDVARKFLFEERKLDPRVIQWCRLTSWRDREGVDWLQIPYFDMDGKLIGVQNRRLTTPNPLKGGSGDKAKSPSKGDLEGLPRFKFPYGSCCSIYNLPVLRLLEPHEECWISEGSSDCWSLLSDHHKALAIASATLLQPRDKELLQRVTAQLSIRWKMAPDQDEPGRNLAAQLKDILPNLEIIDLPPGCKDYSDYHVRHAL